MEHPTHVNRDRDPDPDSGSDVDSDRDQEHDLAIDRTSLVSIVVSITVLALIARFVLLGDRVAHWDEARVGFWILDYMRTGNYSYAPVIHGPFYHHVTPIIFRKFGISDATMRFVPAFVTGLLPLTALLFRDRLRRLEIAALALFMAIGPIFLYYSRFMRGDPIVGTFMFAGFAFLVRAIDTENGWHIIWAGVTIALGFTAKENAFVYVLCWLGGLCVLFDQRLLVARYRDRQWTSVFADTVKRVVDGLVYSSQLVASLVATIVFLCIIVVFYAPRTNGFFGVSGLGAVEKATVGSFMSFYDFWGDGGRAEHAFLPYLGDLLVTVGYGAAALCLFALIGFLVNRYAADRSRPLITFTFAWSLASLLGYPIITDIKAPWAAVHVVLPLMIPAAVGVGIVVRASYSAISSRQWMSAGVLTLILLVASVQIGWVGIHSVYLEPQSEDNELVQYAQPADDLHPTLHEIERIAEKNKKGTDVLIYGPDFVSGDPIYNKPSCTRSEGWFNTLPLPWYLYRSDASVACAETESDLNAINGNPPVIIAKADRVTKNKNGRTVTVTVVPEELRTRFEGYDATIKQLRTTDTDVVFLIDRDRSARMIEPKQLE